LSAKMEKFEGIPLELDIYAIYFLSRFEAPQTA
jgi:hypothetical protein